MAKHPLAKKPAVIEDQQMMAVKGPRKKMTSWPVSKLKLKPKRRSCWIDKNENNRTVLLPTTLTNCNNSSKNRAKTEATNGVEVTALVPFHTILMMTVLLQAIMKASHEHKEMPSGLQL